MRRLALAVLMALPALAQQQQPQQTFFSETIEVRVINVDVIVTKDGHPVTGLTKDDFQVFEDGKPQTITNFLECGERTSRPPGADGTSAPLPDSRARNIVVLFDTTSIDVGGLTRLQKPMNDFLQRVMRRGDHVMMISWNPGLRVEQPFTTDSAEAAATVAKVAGAVTTATLAQNEFATAKNDILNTVKDIGMQKEVSGGSAAPERPDISMAVLVAEGYAQKLMFEQSQRVEAIRSVISSLRGLNGRNVLLVLTNQLSANPALPIFEFIDGVKDRFINAEAFNARDHAKRFEQPSIVQEVSEHANSAGVTLYAIAPAGLGVDLHSIADENRFGEATATSRGVSHADEGLLTLRQLAGATGGMALTSSNNFALAFDTLAQDLTSYYSLGYHTEGQRADAVRSISVKLRKKGYDVRTREAFVERSRGSEMEDAVAANLLYPVAKNDLNVTMTKAGEPATSGKQVVVPVFIRIPTGGLTLVPDGADLVGQFSSYTAFMRGDGKVSDVKHQQHQLRFPAESLKRRKEITVKYELTIDDVTNDVSVGIMDETSHVTGFARMQIKG